MPKTYGLNKSKHFRQSYYTECLMGQDPNGGYIITADKNGDKWIVFAEDHEPSDLYALYPDTYPLDGFDTLKDAASFIWEFVDDFYTLWEENNKDDNDDDQPTTEKTLEVMTQCTDLTLTERDQIVETLENKQQSYDLSDNTVTKFIDSDPDSDLSCDLYQIVFPDTYVAWLNSGLNRSEFVEKTYYLA